MAEHGARQLATCRTGTSEQRTEATRRSFERRRASDGPQRGLRHSFGTMSSTRTILPSRNDATRPGAASGPPSGERTLHTNRCAILVSPFDATTRMPPSFAAPRLPKIASCSRPCR